MTAAAVFGRRPPLLPLGRAGAVRAPDPAGRNHSGRYPTVRARPGPRAPHSTADSKAAMTTERTTHQP